MIFTNDILAMRAVTRYHRNERRRAVNNFHANDPSSRIKIDAAEKTVAECEKHLAKLADGDLDCHTPEAWRTFQQRG